VYDRVAAVERAAQRAPLRAVELLEREQRALEAILEVAERAAREIVDADDLDSLGHETIT
jgi:hypothetical protein